MEQARRFGRSRELPRRRRQAGEQGAAGSESGRVRHTLAAVLVVCTLATVGVAAAPGASAEPVTRCSTGAIQVRESDAPPTPASPYPSRITLSDLGPGISRVSVALSGLTAYAGDLSVLLEAPTGRSMVLMSGVGSKVTQVTGVDLGIQDPGDGEIGTPMPATPDALVSGTYKPTADIPSATFPMVPGPYAHPAPAGDKTLDGWFTGTNPNGTWSLYIVSSYPHGPAGGIAAGSVDSWCITVTADEPEVDVAPEFTSGPCGGAAVFRAFGATSVSFTAEDDNEEDMVTLSAGSLPSYLSFAPGSPDNPTQGQLTGRPRLMDWFSGVLSGPATVEVLASSGDPAKTTTCSLTASVSVL